MVALCSISLILMAQDLSEEALSNGMLRDFVLVLV